MLVKRYGSGTVPPEPSTGQVGEQARGSDILAQEAPEPISMQILPPVPPCHPSPPTQMCTFSPPPLPPSPYTDVQAVGHDCDLAILSVEDEAFWSSPTDMLPLQLGEVPALQQDVIVIG